MTDTPKFCKDCRHFSEGFRAMGLNVSDSCRHPSNMSAPDLVRGWSAPEAVPRDLRTELGNCGPDGHWFQINLPEPVPEPKTLKNITLAELEAENTREWPFPERPRWKVWLSRVAGL